MLPARVPTRDLPFVDALAMLAALFLTYAVRAITNSAYPFAWDGIAPYVRHGLPLCIAAVLLAAAASGLYGSRAATSGLRQHGAAIAYAAVVVTVAGVYWGGPYPPTLVFVAGALAAATAFHLGRRLYWRGFESDGST